MKKLAINFSAWTLLLTVLALGFQSCKKNFDEPPVGDLPILTANATIAQVKALHVIAAGANLVTDDLIVEGIVVSSDETGNFYKQLIIQDATGGIEVRIEQSNLYNDYPVGRQVWIKCKGLYVGDYQGNHQLTINANGDRLPAGLLKNYIVGGARNQPLNPAVVTITDLKSTTNYRNMLVQINDVQFNAIDTNQTFADPVGQLTLNRGIADCGGKNIILRSSGFATFAGQRTPSGNGSIVAVHTNYSADAQLTIRGVEDIQFTAPRCTTSISGNLMNISALRATYTGSATPAPANTKINCYVISNRTTNNLVGQNMVVMDATGGIVVRFTSNHSYSEGDNLEISIGTGSLSEFGGLMQLDGISSANVSVISSGNTVPPTTVTVANLIANAEAYESTLIRINGATLTGNTTYSGNLTINDGTGTITLYTRTGASFASTPILCGTQDIVGVMSQFTSYQVQLRNPSYDIIGGTTCGGGGTATLTSIGSLRSQFTGTSITVAGNLKIKGIVTSDRVNGNIVSQNLTIQDSTAGIVVRFSANHTFNMGDQLEITVTGATLSEFGGLLQVSGTSLTTASASVVSTGNTVTPRTATIAQINTNSEAWESTLVKVVGATISGGATYGANSGNLTLNDGTGTITLYTRTAATFAGTAPATGTVSVTAVISQFNTTKQLTIRNTSDVQ